MHWIIVNFMLKLCLRYMSCLLNLTLIKFQCICMEINPLYYSTLTAYWSWMRNHCTLSQWSTRQWTQAQAWAVLLVQRGGFRLCCAAQSPGCRTNCFNGEAWRQLPLGTCGYTTCLALPLSSCAAGSSMRVSFRNRVGFFWGYYMTTQMTKNEGSSPQTLRAFQGTVGKIYPDFKWCCMSVGSPAPGDAGFSRSLYFSSLSVLLQQLSY